MPGIRSAVLIPVALTASLALTACAREISPNVVDGATVGQAANTQMGWIESRRTVQVREGDRLQDNTAGILIGGAFGGLAGNQFGSGAGRVALTGVGALAGATVGAVAQQQMTNQLATEYVFRNEIGQIYTIVQGQQPQLQPGQRVYLQQYSGGRARLVPAG